VEEKENASRIKTTAGRQNGHVKAREIYEAGVYLVYRGIHASSTKKEK